MGVQFNVYDWAAEEFVGEAVDMSATSAKHLGALTGITFVTAEAADGECSLAELRAGLKRVPDGHADPLIGQRIGELIRLLLTAEKRNPDLRVSWG